MTKVCVFIALLLVVLVNCEQNTPIVITTWDFVNSTISGKYINIIND